MFTTPVFIRKNTPELRHKLKELGYEICFCARFSDINCWLFNTEDTIHVITPEQQDDFLGEIKLTKDKIIDCGTNDELFLALASLNDDSDYMQYFTNRYDFILCDREDWVDMYSVLCIGKRHGYQDVLDNYHKATKEEIIEHFKQKTNGK